MPNAEALVAGRAVPLRPDHVTLETTDDRSTYATSPCARSSLGKDDTASRASCSTASRFPVGPLDQGFWPDGLYTAPTDEALQYDIEMTKKLGFNMARKHVKVEPERWYYWCRQARPAGLAGHAQRRHATSARDRPISAHAESRSSSCEWPIDRRAPQPPVASSCGCRSTRDGASTTRRAIVEWLKSSTPTPPREQRQRLDRHGRRRRPRHPRYPGPASPQARSEARRGARRVRRPRAAVEGHTWQTQGNWGYRSFTTPAALTEAYVGSARAAPPASARPGSSAAVYTQTTDVEIEVNGLMTYDRGRDQARRRALRAANLGLFTTAADVTHDRRDLTRHAGRRGATSRSAPPADWFAPAFDDAARGRAARADSARPRRPARPSARPGAARTSGFDARSRCPRTISAVAAAVPAASRRGRRDVRQRRAGS